MATVMGMYRDETQDRWVVRDNGVFSDVHPCGEPNQYAVLVDERGLFLRMVPCEDWVAEPRIIDVTTLNGTARL